MDGPALTAFPSGLASAPVKVSDVRTNVRHELRFVAGMLSRSSRHQRNGRGIRGAPRRQGPRGRTTVNVAPRPGSLATSIVPPWATTIDRAMYSPSPRPP